MQPTSPANVPFVILGTGMLWFGWFGFNAGSAVAANGTAALAFATTNTASAAAMLGWMFFDWMRGRKPSAMGACIGAVVGLVAITPAAGFVTVRESIVIGLVASVVSNLAVHWKSKLTARRHARRLPLPRRRRHGRHDLHGHLRQGRRPDSAARPPRSSYHLLALVIVSVFSFVGSLILYKITDLIIPLRVTEEQEIEGPRPQPARRDGVLDRRGPHRRQRAQSRHQQRQAGRKRPGGRGVSRADGGFRVFVGWLGPPSWSSNGGPSPPYEDAESAITASPPGLVSQAEGMDGHQDALLFLLMGDVAGLLDALDGRFVRGPVDRGRGFEPASQGGKGGLGRGSEPGQGVARALAHEQRRIVQKLRQRRDDLRGDGFEPSHLIGRLGAEHVCVVALGLTAGDIPGIERDRLRDPGPVAHRQVVEFQQADARGHLD